MPNYNRNSLVDMPTLTTLTLDFEKPRFMNMDSDLSEISSYF